MLVINIQRYALHMDLQARSYQKYTSITSVVCFCGDDNNVPSDSHRKKQENERSSHFRAITEIRHDDYGSQYSRISKRVRKLLCACVPVRTAAGTYGGT